MSFLRCHRECVPTENVKLATSHSKMVSKDEVVGGELVTKYEFGVADFKTDPRKGLSIHDFGLSNIRKLGKLGDLKEVTLQRNDVDMVIDSLSRMQDEKPVEVSAQTPQTGQSK